MKNIQQAMQEDLASKEIFEMAQSFGFDYLEKSTSRHIFPTSQAVDNLKFFDEPFPVAAAPAKEVINLLQQYGSPATVSQIGGRYFGFVDGGAVPAGMAAKLLGTFWDQNTAMYVMSPICSKLETVVESWLKELFQLPPSAVAGFVSGTSPANFCGLAAGRWRLLKRQHWDVNAKGLYNAPPIRIVAGKHAHSTVIKAINLLGMGNENVEWIDVDDQGRIDPSALPALDDKTLLILQAGEVNTGSFDPFAELISKAKAANAWVHVDGAFGLWAAASPQLAHLTAGMNQADSFAADAHKTLNTPYDSGIVLCSDKEAYLSALQISGSYLATSDQARDGMLYTQEASRRSRIIELWATLKFLGRSGLAEMINNLHARALQFAAALKKVGGFEIVNNVVFNQVLVRCDSDEKTAQVLGRIQEFRDCWVGGSVWQGRKVIRISVCSWATTEDDVVKSAMSFKKAMESDY